MQRPAWLRWLAWIDGPTGEERASNAALSNYAKVSIRLATVTQNARALPSIQFNGEVTTHHNRHAYVPVSSERDPELHRRSREVARAIGLDIAR